MLARSFLPAEYFEREHNLTRVEYDALITVLGMIERGEINDGFTMSFFYYARPYLGGCGTPACMIGWANHVSRGQAFRELNSLTKIADRVSSRLSTEAGELFAVRFSHLSVNRATARQAGRALASFLTTGKHNWQEAMANG